MAKVRVSNTAMPADRMESPTERQSARFKDMLLSAFRFVLTSRLHVDLECNPRSRVPLGFQFG